MFDSVTQEISAEKNTLSKMIVLVRLLTSKLKSYELVNMCEEVKKLPGKLLNNLCDRYRYLSKDVIAHAAILDPRLKKRI